MNDTLAIASSAPHREDVPVLRIERTRGWVSLGLGELWRFRELIYFFIWRDIKVRYKQTALGAAWAVIQPLFSMLIFSVFFGRLAKVPSEGIPYPIFSYAALVVWGFFAYGLTHGAGSLVEGASLIKKVYFPRLAVPIATVLAGGADFVIAFVVLLGMMWHYGRVPTVHVFWLPLLLLLALVTSLGTTFWFCALNVRYRDVRYIIPFLVQAWLFATPVAYPSTLLSERWRILYALNPMAGVVEGFRWALLGTNTAPGPMIIASSLVALAVLFSGALYFRRMERTFADIA